MLSVHHIRHRAPVFVSEVNCFVLHVWERNQELTCKCVVHYQTLYMHLSPRSADVSDGCRSRFWAALFRMHHTTCAVCVFSNNHLIIIRNNYFCFISFFSVLQSCATFTFPSKHLIRTMNQIIRWSEFCYSCHKYLFQGETTLIWAQGKVLKLGHTGGGRELKTFQKFLGKTQSSCCCRFVGTCKCSTSFVEIKQWMIWSQFECS